LLQRPIGYLRIVMHHLIDERRAEIAQLCQR
jgi:hypothetical protein